MSRALAGVVALAALAALASGCSDSAPAPAPAPHPDTPPPPVVVEQVIALDRKLLQPLHHADLAAGGGWIYWIERPRDAPAYVRRRARSLAAPAELVPTPEPVIAIAADGARLYVATGAQVTAQPHAGGAATALATGDWLEIVPGARAILLRSRDQVALVPATGGAAPTPLWSGKHSRLAVAVDGDDFVMVPGSPWSQTTAARAVTSYRLDTPPRILGEIAGPRGDLGVDSRAVYLAPAEPGPLTRLPRAGGPATPFGDPSWKFGELIVRGSALYGMADTGTGWQLQRLPLTTGARPQPLDADLPRELAALTADDRHVYYATGFEIRRVAR